MNDYLEDEFREPFQAWKANPTPAANAQILTTLHPVIEKGVKTHVGDSNPLLISRARKLTLNGLRSYDPARSRLQTHLFNQYQGLKRISRQQTQPIHIPERVQSDSYNLQNYTQELRDELGREPTDNELADRTGFSPRRMSKIRQYQPGMAEGNLEAVAPGFSPGVQSNGKLRDMWIQIVYDDLSAIDQKILEHTLGMHGQPMLSNQDLARRLGRSPGAISQRKARIQQLLDQEDSLSPFGGGP